MRAVSVVALIDVYRVLRLQQETLARLMVGTDALVKSLAESSPQFLVEFEKQQKVVEQSPTARLLAGTIELIDETIRRLEAEAGATS